MKFIITLCLATVALTAPQYGDRDRFANILRYDRIDNNDGHFNYAIAADNGIEMEVAGTPGSTGGVHMQGFYMMPLEDGSSARVDFIANNGGYQASSDIFPTPHPMPAHALQQIENAQQQKARGIQFDIQGRRLN